MMYCVYIKSGRYDNIVDVERFEAANKSDAIEKFSNDRNLLYIQIPAEYLELSTQDVDVVYDPTKTEFAEILSDLQTVRPSKGIGGGWYIIRVKEDEEGNECNWAQWVIDQKRASA